MNLKFLKATGASLATAAALSLTLPAAATAQADQSVDIRADAVQLTGDALKAAFTNVSHDGAYNFGRNGKARSTYIETTTSDGRTFYIEDGEISMGDWVVSDSVLCFRYDTNDMQGGCFNVYTIANCYYYYGAALAGRIDPNSDTFWTARSVRKGDRVECDMIS